MENKIKDISKLEKKYLLEDLTQEDLELLKDIGIICYVAHITKTSHPNIEDIQKIGEYLYTDYEDLNNSLLNIELQTEDSNFNYVTEEFNIASYINLNFNKEQILDKEIKIETNLENTKKVIDFIDKQLDSRNTNKDLSSILEDDLQQSSNRREVLLSRGINKIDLKDISFEEKNTQIKVLHELSLNDLESKYGKKSEELEALTNNSILKVANTFVKTYTGNTKDEIKVSDSYEEFIDKKVPNIINKQVEESEIFKSYQSKLSKYVRENKNTDSAFIKLLNHYANLPTKILEQSFKEAILSGEKVATIRNTKHYNVGTIFKLNLGSRFKPDNIGKARCRVLFKTETSRFLHYLKYHIKTKENAIPFWDNIGIPLGFPPTKLGFNNLEGALEFYKIYLKNEYCYLHIFEVIEEK